jgi:hypothetical protein
VYPDPLRFVTYCDPESCKRLKFLTNNFTLPPLAIVRKRLGVEASLYQLLQIFSVTLFEKTPILQTLRRDGYQEELSEPSTQLILFDF